jgi:hypothetical protein
MVSKKKTCVQQDCDAIPVFGAPDQKISHCMRQSKPGRSNNRTRNVRTALCIDLASHGYPRAIAKRVTHAKPDMVDLLNKECTSCNLKTLSERKGIVVLRSRRRSSTYVCPSNEPSKIISARTRTFRSGIRPENRQASGVGMHQGTTRLLFRPGQRDHDRRIR